MKAEKCVIFGAGDRGTKLYEKLSLCCDVIAYSDNDSRLWGSSVNDVAVVPPNDLPALVEKTKAFIVIANDHYYLEIAKQLDDYGLTYYICNNFRHLCYALDNEVYYPVSFGRPAAHKKTGEKGTSVLFVQEKPCTRTNKIAEAFKRRGIATYAAYIMAASDAGEQAYDEEFPFWTYADLLDFVNESEFDVVHCSNTPDILVNVLLHSNKRIIHDCHDIVTAEKKSVHPVEEAQEFIANTQADGVIYATEAAREIMRRKYGIKKDRTLVLGNYPLSSFREINFLPKLSASDGAIHCVYEGGLEDKKGGEEMPYRFFEPLFVQLSQFGVHIHIYSQSKPEYLKQLDSEYDNIHYEGNYNGRELIEKMTQYDLGFALYPQGYSYMECSSPNKVYEYLSAGLPVITNVKALAEIIEANNCGGALDLDRDDVISKLRAYQKISLSVDFCDTHGFTVDSQVDRILEFYKKTLEKES